MIPLASSVLGLVLPILSNATVVDLAVASRGELGAGYISAASQVAAVPAVQANVDLRAGLRSRSEDSTFILATGPRLYALLPNSAGIDRPLIFYRLDGSYQLQATPRLQLQANFGGGAGELSYATLAQGFVPGTGVVAASVIPVATGSASAGGTFQQTRRNQLGLTLATSAQKGLGDAGDIGVASFVAGGVGVTDTYQVTARDSLAFTLLFTAAFSQIQGDYVSVGNTLNYRRRLDITSVLDLVGGAQVVHNPLDQNVVLPSGYAAYTTTWGARGERWTAGLSGGLRAFFDRLNFIFIPQIFLQSSISVDWSPTNRSAVNLFGSTSASRQPQAPGVLETFLGLEIPHQVKLSDTLWFSAGFRGQLRGPHFSELERATVQGQAIVFSGLNWGEGTDREHGAFLQ